VLWSDCGCMSWHVCMYTVYNTEKDCMEVVSSSRAMERAKLTRKPFQTTEKINDSGKFFPCFTLFFSQPGIMPSKMFQKHMQCSPSCGQVRALLTYCVTSLHCLWWLTIHRSPCGWRCKMSSQLHCIRHPHGLSWSWGMTLDRTWSHWRCSLCLKRYIYGLHPAGTDVK